MVERAPNHSSIARDATRLAGLGCLFILLGALACSPRTRRTPDDTVVVLIPNLIRDMDPRFALTNYDVKLSRLVAVGLTTVDREDLEPVLALAESIELETPTTVRVVIRADARFSDNSPVTAKDVAFTFESTMSDELGSLYRKSFSERFERFEIIGERDLRIHLVSPVATLMGDLDFGIVSAAAADSSGRYPGGKIVGAGPFRVVRSGGEGALLERNPHYFGTPAAAEKLEIRVIRDSNARTLMLVGGSADFTQNSIRVDLVDQVAGHDRLKLVAGPSAILSYLMMHNEDPVLSDVRVRKAIAHAVDRQRIVSAKMGGRAVLATGLLPPSHWGYNGEVSRYEFDPAKAKALLDEAGYPDPDGDGPKTRLTLSYKTSADQFRLTIARIIASQLADVGIDIDVRSFEFGTFFADIKRGNYQLASMQTADITEPDYFYTYFHSARIPSEKDKHVHNRWRFRNARVDDLTLRGRKEMNRPARKVLYDEVQEILATELPIVPLWHEDNLALMNVDVDGYVVYPNARFFGLSVAGKRARSSADSN